MIKAVILDMDGLLIDSEPIWEEAEVAVFSKVGVPLTLSMTRQTMGLRVDEVVEHWFKRYPWTGTEKETVQMEIIQEVIKLIKEKGVAKPGVRELISQVKKENLPLAVASSSFTEIINAALEKLDIKNQIDLIYSAEFEPKGKPHPGVYLTTAKKLNVLPQYCLAFEDSPNGLAAAKAANMKCIAVPDEKVIGDKRFSIADRILNSLLDFKIGYLQE